MSCFLLSAFFKAFFHDFIFSEANKDVEETLKKCIQYFSDAAESYVKVR